MGVKLGTGVNVGVSEGVSNVNVWEGVTLGVVVMGGSVGVKLDENGDAIPGITDYIGEVMGENLVISQ